jgi:hypothetical protein
MANERTFTTQDVLTAFPWISGATLHYRIKHGFLPLANRSFTRGIANTFTEAELIQAGVLDCLATFGVLTNMPRGTEKKRASHSVTANAHFADLSLTTPVGQKPPPPDTPIELASPWDMRHIAPIYRKHDYDVTIQIRTQYRGRPKPVRFYGIYYYPSKFDGNDTAQKALKKYQDIEAQGTYLAIGFVFVLQLFAEADVALGLR